MAVGETFRVAAYQSQGMVHAAADRLIELRKMINQADENAVDVLVFPECFLTGYFSDKDAAWSSSISIDDQVFAQVCEATKGFSSSIVLGFNERQGQHLYNTAAVIEDGRCQGIYRKTYLYHGYHSPGNDFPVFLKKGILFGIVICLDSYYLEPCRILARKGAKIIFCPMNNLVPPQHKYAQRLPYYSHLVARSFENNCWFVSADIVSPYSGAFVCPGHSLIYDSDGNEVARSQEFAEEFLIYDIPMSSLKRDRPLRLFGNPEVIKAYGDSERTS